MVIVWLSVELCWSGLWLGAHDLNVAIQRQWKKTVRDGINVWTYGLQIIDGWTLNTIHHELSFAPLGRRYKRAFIGWTRCQDRNTIVAIGLNYTTFSWVKPELLRWGSSQEEGTVPHFNSTQLSCFKVLTCYRFIQYWLWYDTVRWLMLQVWRSSWRKSRRLKRCMMIRRVSWWAVNLSYRLTSIDSNNV